MTYREKLSARITATGSNLCVGLDIRAGAADESTKQQIIQIIEETAPFAAAFKPNAAYFEALGWQGMKMLSEVLKAVPADIPVVFVAVVDPVAFGLVANLERPGGNVTGVTSFDPQQPRSQMRLLKETLPGLARVAFLGDGDVIDSLQGPAVAGQDKV